MHSLLYYETRTPSYDAHWGAQARALADLRSERTAAKTKRARRPALRWTPRRTPAAAGC